MAIQFPQNPQIGDTFAVGSTVYAYNGVAWGGTDSLSAVYTGYTGSIGYTGSAGSGSADATKIILNDTQIAITDTGTGSFIDVIVDGQRAVKIDSNAIVPRADQVYDLGSPSLQWKDIYVGPGSLYVNGQKVLQEDAGNIIVSCDADQNLIIQTAGSGNLELDPTGAGAVVIKGPLQIQAGNNVLSSDGNPIVFGSGVAIDTITSKTTNADLTMSANGTGHVRVDDDLVVTGNLTISGTTTTVNTQTLSVADNIIDLNSDFTVGTPTENAGIRIMRGDEPAVLIRWNEAVNQWEFTNDGATYTALGIGGGSSTLDGLTDVVVTTPTTGQALVFDGTNWVNDMVEGGGSVSGGDSAVFKVIKTSTQSITASTWTKVTFNSELADTNSSFDLTNSKFQPTVAGYYQINANVYVTGTNITSVVVGIKKNGSFDYSSNQEVQPASANQSGQVSGLHYLNGTTDYLELFALAVGTSPVIANDPGTSFSGHLITAAGSSASVAFHASKGVGQSTTTGTSTKVTIDAKAYDTNGFFDTSLSRFKPAIAGYYSIGSLVHVNSTTSSITTVNASFFKNGAGYRTLQNVTLANPNSCNINGTTEVYLNGTTDYIEIYVTPWAGGTITIGGTIWGHLISSSNVGTVVSSTAPTNPANGNTWFNAENGTRYTYYFDGTTGSWVADGTETQLNVYPNKLTQGTAVTASGTSVDFAGIPSWVKRITLSLVDISTTGTSNPMIQLGDSGGVETAGYAGRTSYISGANVCSTGALSSGISVVSSAAANALHGQFVLTNVTGNTWAASGLVGNSYTTVTYHVAGSKALSDVLTTVRLTTANGTDTFDAGTINIMYE